ncbi:MAG: AraC family transcriptional regulator [Marinoscillum sp.]|uniref:helix-turn-helix domain-containing protein n=1 Tax=Marinoscillum sp. TaxID=2024838 RepID=UPI003300923E
MYKRDIFLMMKKINVLDLAEFERSGNPLDFYCNTFSRHLQAHHGAITAPHKHNFFLIVLFTSGSGLHEIDFEKYRVTPGSVFFLAPGQTHYWELSDDIDGLIFFHSQEFFDLSFTDRSVYDFPFFYSLLNSATLQLNPPDTKRMAALFNELLTEYSGKNTFMTTQKLSSLLSLTYIELSRLYLAQGQMEVSKTGIYSEYLRKLEKLIEENFRTLKSPAAYAQQLHITVRHLNRLTQESLGKSTTQLITERVLLEAKRMLVHGSTSLTHIAYDLGYEDYAYFSRLFKKWTGHTPSSFAQQYQSGRTRNLPPNP